MSEQVEANRRVIAVLESSKVLGVVDRLFGLVWRAATGSAVVGTAARLAKGWLGLDVPLRRRAVGTMLVVAVAVHLVLTVITQTPPGWLWLMMPAIFAAMGLLLALAPDLPGMARR